MKKLALLLLSLCLPAAACSFSPPAASPPDALATGAPCGSDDQCSSGLCSPTEGTSGVCVECRMSSPCAGGGTCGADGRCTAVQGQQRHAGVIGGLERVNNEGRTHVGRVAVAPIQTVVAE